MEVPPNSLIKLCRCAGLGPTWHANLSRVLGEMAACA